jgi:hypothetical protein
MVPYIIEITEVSREQHSFYTSFHILGSRRPTNLRFFFQNRVAPASISINPRYYVWIKQSHFHCLYGCLFIWVSGERKHQNKSRDKNLRPTLWTNDRIVILTAVISLYYLMFKAEATPTNKESQGAWLPDSSVQAQICYCW